MIKHDLLVEDLLSHLDESERANLLAVFEKFSIPPTLIVKPFDDVSNISDFYDYLAKYPFLKKELLDDLCSEQCLPWLQRVAESGNAFFLICNSRWKCRNKEIPVKISLKLILIGSSESPTIEINIE